MQAQVRGTHHRIMLSTRQYYPGQRARSQARKRRPCHPERTRVLRETPTLLALADTSTQPLLCAGDRGIKAGHAPIAIQRFIMSCIPADRSCCELARTSQIILRPRYLWTEPHDALYCYTEPLARERQANVHAQRMTDDE